MPVNRPPRAEIERKTIETYQEAPQMLKCAEECAELIHAITRSMLPNEDFDEQVGHIREEITDVQIMLVQLKMIFGPTGIEEGAKLARLAKRLGMLETIGESR